MALHKPYVVFAVNLSFPFLHVYALPCLTPKLGDLLFGGLILLTLAFDTLPLPLAATFELCKKNQKSGCTPDAQENTWGLVVPITIARI
jgi:hypothetical protein